MSGASEAKKITKYANEIMRLMAMNNKKELEQRIADLERLLADAVRFIAYAQSKGVHGGEAIAKEIKKSLKKI